LFIGTSFAFGVMRFTTFSYRFFTLSAYFAVVLNYNYMIALGKKNWMAWQKLA